jgi:transcriptional regulator with XRE-family HTH domain
MPSELYDLSVPLTPSLTPSPRIEAGSGTLGRQLVYGIEASSPSIQARRAPQVVILLESAADMEAFWPRCLAYEFKEGALQGLRLLIHEAFSAPVGETSLVAFSATTRDADEVASIFSLSASQAAAVLGTSRQTIYAWRRGQPVRRSELRDRIAKLRGLALEWQKQSKLPVGEGLEHRDPRTGHTLLELLQASSLDENEVRTHLSRLKRHLSDFWGKSDSLLARHDADNWAPLAPGWKQETTQELARGNLRTPRP